ncbi:GMP synthase [glutamine-hydrolyzing] [Striga asiatica]|uniref:GMP synthase [glutamine-hydrolyzing] n=1 Tax=Striga asiatica TaxID=4170 RepID=A0A5A7P7I3_STRAF|nr:GMP synthase [glutamine-hydrolyzing] [Striga asiatica]
MGPDKRFPVSTRFVRRFTPRMVMGPDKELKLRSRNWRVGGSGGIWPMKRFRERLKVERLVKSEREGIRAVNRFPLRDKALSLVGRVGGRGPERALSSKTRVVKRERRKKA